MKRLAHPQISATFHIVKSHNHYFDFSRRLYDLTAETIRAEAEEIEVNIFPNVWKGNKCDGVRTSYSLLLI